MNDPKIPSSSLTRRGFMKNSALTVGAITMLSQGIALATNGSGTSGSGAKETVLSREEYEVTIDGDVHLEDNENPRPTPENYSTNSNYVGDKDKAERSWPENKTPTSSNALLVDNDYIEVDSPAPTPTKTITTNPSIDDTAPQIISSGANGWHFRWVFRSVVTYSY
ncbi:twin-arginine translocation signal domain-containing protein [Luteolibacter sp. GHJ8]|uniref:Twin-arginine translocation signal domain-containing protein n=1 Tax=Luteolibacter rhizosphaerae TaxID=2989719 RepID=A0ABT3G781_9BACT|nr:twin-arginine translocation signal domain-containing protein [Luteolibacter rhizosphaerae]MCW1915660.1 twin-arginine translocation signal domain-containing protein [Luteolibacter rhizosphaerae]